MCKIITEGKVLGLFYFFGQMFNAAVSYPSECPRWHSFLGLGQP